MVITMSMPVEWEYMEKDSGVLTSIGKGVANAGKKIMGNSVTSGISNFAGGMAGTMVAGTAIEKAKEHIPGGYQ